MRILRCLQHLHLPHKAEGLFATYSSSLVNPTWNRRQFWVQCPRYYVAVSNRSVDAPQRQGSADTESQEQTSHLAGTHIDHDIGTLDPRRLSALDYVDLSDIHSVKIGDTSAATLIYGEMYEMSMKLLMELMEAVQMPDGSPTSFASGTDLLLPSGLPWEAPIVVLGNASIVSYAKLRQMLLRDDLVAQPLLDKCTELGIQEDDSVTLMHSLGQPFHMGFTRRSATFWLVGEDGLSVHPVIFKYLFKGMSERRCPYSGSALCCFERSTLPQHAGTRTAVLRIVKIVRPPVPHQTFMGKLPREGELHQRYDRVWSFNVDHPPQWALGNNLGMLFEREEQRVLLFSDANIIACISDPGGGVLGGFSKRSEANDVDDKTRASSWSHRSVLSVPTAVDAVARMRSDGWWRGSDTAAGRRAGAARRICPRRAMALRVSFLVSPSLFTRPPDVYEILSPPVRFGAGACWCREV
ncbi:hypothetical protein A0H81_05067 [Grifola frondosa]|uniref:Uncharacterized protein n=1 Tax=Grifola frondosa TaxID=5627 RepID=A0A1C7MEF3_GRIFR|nr:hypothetical protein A0H81_05067 [Grifola frondosa]